MPRLILSTQAGAQTADIRASALSVPQVQDAQEAAQAGAVIVNVSDVTTATRQRLADLPGVDAVFDDIQGFPLIADADEAEDFLQRVRDRRGEENVPLPIETKPTRQGDAVPDGGAQLLPVPSGERSADAQAQGPITDASASVEWTGASNLHDQGITGESVIAVVVDTGSCAASFADDRRLDGSDLTGDDDPWTPMTGHGGMTMGIMAGGPETPGIDVGFLPDADLYPIKTTLAASELMQAADIIVQLAEDNPDKTVVVNHSWGFPECTGICDHPVTSAIGNSATHDRVIQVIAAGNEGGDGTTACGVECDGSSPGISGPNSLNELVTVAASGRNGVPTEIQPYSSRGGPGTVSCGREKPDVSAPTFGTVPYGCESREMGNGGGTSAACPQVAGAVGLIADAKNRVSTAAASTGLVESALPFDGDGFDGCSGAGNIQADAAVDAAPSETPLGGGVNVGDVGDTIGIAALSLGIGAIGAVAANRR